MYDRKTGGVCEKQVRLAHDHVFKNRALYGIILNCTLIYVNIRCYVPLFSHRRKNRGAEHIWLDYWLKTIIRKHVERRRRSFSKYRILNTWESTWNTQIVITRVPELPQGSEFTFPSRGHCHTWLNIVDSSLTLSGEHLASVGWGFASECPKWHFNVTHDLCVGTCAGVELGSGRNYFWIGSFAQRAKKGQTINKHKQRKERTETKEQRKKREENGSAGK